MGVNVLVIIMINGEAHFAGLDSKSVLLWMNSVIHILTSTFVFCGLLSQLPGASYQTCPVLKSAHLLQAGFTWNCCHVIRK